jgi:hypothetical protein
MLEKTLARPLVAMLSLSLAAVPLPARASQSVHCASVGNRYQYCRTDTDNEVRLERQISGARCVEGSSWGYDRYGVWVDRGCEAEFRVGKGRDRDSAVAAGAAIAGIAIIAALAASKSGHQSSDLPSWAVGSFSAYDDYEQTDVQLTILPGGSVSGHAGRNEFDGHFADLRLEAGRQVFRVERAGNGFVATDERNPAHRVVFRRSGGGY